MPKPTPKFTPKEVHLLQLKEFLERYYFEPDIPALTVALSIYCAHTSLQDDPVWSFFVGPSGGQKTSVIIRGLSFLPNTCVVDSLGAGSFLSGYGSENGILQRMTNGMILFPDFSTFLGLRQEVRTELQAQLRSMYDGRLVKAVGSKNKEIVWKGKVSIIAACTEAIERYWGFGRDLGERFLFTSMSPVTDTSKIMKMAIAQIGKEKDIEVGFSQVVNTFVDPQTLHTIPIGKWKMDEIMNLCMLAAELRRNVHREGNDISIVDSAEHPTRLIKALISVARGHGMLMRKKETDEDDMKLAKGLCLSTIPRHRLTIIRYLLSCPNHTAPQDEIIYDLDVPRSTTKRRLEDLQAINAIQVSTVRHRIPDLKISDHLRLLCGEVAPLYRR